MIKQGRVPHQPEKVLDYVVRLRESVGAHKATWHYLQLQQEQHADVEVLRSIAAEAKLPAQFDQKPLGNASYVLTADVLIGGLFVSLVVSVALSLGVLTLNQYLGTKPAPGLAQKLPFTRAKLVWSEVQDEIKRVESYPLNL